MLALAQRIVLAHRRLAAAVPAARGRNRCRRHNLHAGRKPVLHDQRERPAAANPASGAGSLRKAVVGFNAGGGVSLPIDLTAAGALRGPRCGDRSSRSRSPRRLPQRDLAGHQRRG